MLPGQPCLLIGVAPQPLKTRMYMITALLATLPTKALVTFFGELFLFLRM